MATPSQRVFTASLPEYYERALVGPLFRPFAEVLLHRVAVLSGDRLLDVACGTGIVARLAQQQLADTGRVVGLDASPNMLAVATRVAPMIEWREGNAATLPFSDAEFDVVTCHQGLQFFSERAAAAKEMRRVLARGGRLAVAVWRGLEAVPLMNASHRVAERHLGPVVDQRHAFGNPAALSALLAEAGFQRVAVEAVTRTIRINDAAAFAHMNTMAIVGMSPAAKAMPEEQRAEVSATIANQSLDTWQPFVDGSDLVFELGTNIATAHV